VWTKSENLRTITYILKTIRETKCREDNYSALQTTTQKSHGDILVKWTNKVTIQYNGKVITVNIRTT
jgi:ABC-type sulfate transport system substrate-binding protein